jgi:hypothetical protein
LVGVAAKVIDSRSTGTLSCRHKGIALLFYLCDQGLKVLGHLGIEICGEYEREHLI